MEVFLKRKKTHRTPTRARQQNDSHSCSFRPILCIFLAEYLPKPTLCVNLHAENQVNRNNISSKASPHYSYLPRH